MDRLNNLRNIYHIKSLNKKVSLRNLGFLMLFIWGAYFSVLGQDTSDKEDSKLKTQLKKTGSSVREELNRALSNDGKPLITVDTSLIDVNDPTILESPDLNRTGDNKSNSDSAQDTLLKYPVRNLENEPYNEKGYSGMDLQDPSNFSNDVEYDTETGSYLFKSKVGETELDVPETMTFDEYKNYDIQKSLNSYFNSLGTNVSDDDKLGILDAIGVGAEGKIFGPGGINVKPQGYAELSFGVKTNTIDNPTLPERLRKTTVFDFDEKIQMNINGSVGDKINLGMNYNTEATFDFDNKIKLNYEGKEDDIIKKVEAGNVSLPLGGTLINGSQSLFGFKTEMQFGRLTATTVFSQQESETETMTLEGGATTSEFEIKVNEYDANRHFFLNHFFKSQYDASLRQLPVIRSGVTITKVEVWITNKQSNYEEARSIVAFSDLAEPKDIYNSQWTASSNVYGNDANSLYNDLKGNTGIRDVSQITSTMAGLGLKGALDYEKIENARRLKSSEYTLNHKLGYISLRSALNNDEVLAIAYEYTYNGVAYRVGEFSTDGIPSSNTLIVKLIKGTNLSPNVPTWDLMMKNIYSLGAYQVNRDDFEMNIVFEDDSSGTKLRYIPEPGVRDKRLIQIMNLDRLNRNQEDGSDGKFDYLEGYTMNSQYGKIIFPVREPFSTEYLNKAYGGNLKIGDAYGFDEVYDSTYTKAKEAAERNKFLLTGEYKSESGSEIKLNAMNIPRGSVKVTAGGRTLSENIDYSVDYSSGYVKILNSSLLESGAPIKISMENQAMFSMQKKTMLGTHLDYRFNDDFNVGATVMHLYEKPLTQKVSMGEDPIANTVWGMNTSYRTESRWLTRMVDKLPFIETKAPSSISVDAEVAQLIPGHAKAVGKSGAAYIDDFESTQVGIDLSNYFSWKLASTPEGLQAEGDKTNDLEYGYNRAKIAWYTIDRIFQEESSLTPPNINSEERSNHYARAVNERNLFPNRDQSYGESSLLSILNVAYYPEEKGPYNFDTNLTSEGLLKNPEERWGGIMRKVESSDFEKANIEYVEFWVMDPYLDHSEAMKADESDAAIYFQLGNVSEDILKDGRKGFEHGLSSDGSDVNIVETEWGNVSSLQSLVTAFNNSAESRKYQDVGLDGMDDITEGSRRSEYLESLDGLSPLTDEGKKRVAFLRSDPSQDNYRYFRSSEWDKESASILERYKRYNNTDGNSPTSNMSEETYPTASTTLPDLEDINQDNTLSEIEGYYQYKVDMSPSKLNLSNNFIIQKKVENVTLANGVKDSINWYLFKVPIKEGYTTQGSISDFSSIRFMRMVMKNFHHPVVFRFASLELVRGDWRVYTNELLDDITTSGDITIESVNIEENNDKDPVNYLLPPGVTRVIDPSQPQLTQLNEESMVLKVKNLSPGGAKAVYKSTDLDIRMYKKLQMYVHAEGILDDVNSLKDGELSVFLRLGSDYKKNYYEYEIPLTITPAGEYIDNESNREIVWPEDNFFNFSLDELTNLKLQRNRAKQSFQESYGPIVAENNKSHWRYIKGNPSLANIKTIMIGVRNKVNGNVSELKSGEIWVNELRLSEYDEDGGWAGRASVSMKLADLGSVNVGGGFTTSGWGSLEGQIADRQMDDKYNYDVSTNVELGRFFPKKANVTIPLMYTYSQNVSNPKYSPYNEDIELKEELDNAASSSQRDSIKEISQIFESRKSLNLMNVKVNKTSKKPMPYDPGNVSASYGYNETYRRSPDIEREIDKNFNGVLEYQYSPQVKPVKPFSKVGFLDNQYLALIRDFNFYLLPKSIGLKTDMLRNYSETKERDLTNDGGLPVSVAKDFYWNRGMNISYDLTQSINIRFSTLNNAIIDEPDTLADGRTLLLDRRNLEDDYKIWRDSVWRKIRKFGRATMYNQTINASYNLPFNKLPLTDWINANASYGGTYSWDRGPNIYNEVNKKYEYSLGHTIRNTQNINVQSDFNMTQLYTKISWLDDVNKELGRQNRSNRKRYKTVKYEKAGYSLEKGKDILIPHNLGAKRVTVRAYKEKDKPVRGKSYPNGDNEVKYTPVENAENVRFVITARVEDKDSPAEKIAKRFARVAMSLKSIGFTYNENNSTVLPGFDRDELSFGQDNNAPGWPFALGMQDPDFGMRASRNGWLANDTIDSPYMYASSKQLTVKASIEPLNSLRIELTGIWNDSRSNSAYIVPSAANGVYREVSPVETGIFNMSYNFIGTAFSKVGSDANYTSEVYNEFLSNRNIVATRLAKKRESEGTYDPDYTANSEYSDKTSDGHNGYDLNSSEVLIPAFLAAYSGKSADGIGLSAFPSWREIVPNWRINYTGLGRVKFMKKHFRSVTLSHSYNSMYNVGSYTSNLGWNEEGDGFGWVRETLYKKFFVPRYDITTVSMVETFAPLLRIDMNWRNNLSTSLEMRKSRNISMNISSAQMVEVYNDEFVLGLGYRFDKLPIFVNSKAVDNDLNLRSDISVRDNKSIIRRFGDAESSNLYSQASSGQKVVTVKFNADYNLSKSVNLRLYYDRIVTNPLVSTSFRTANSNVGVSFRFTLAQ